MYLKDNYRRLRVKPASIKWQSDDSAVIFGRALANEFIAGKSKHKLNYLHYPGR
jgi:hypothetical protein